MRRLRVSANHRTLEYEDGTPFLYLGDTAWELLHRLTLEETRHYLSNRAAKGFTVIQAVVLSELAGVTEPTPEGHLPLIDRDPTRPNAPYFEHVDAVVQAAASLGLVMGLLPTWGSLWKQGDGRTPIFDEKNAFTYGEFVGRRYRDQPIIWILGGDQNIERPSEHAVIDAMARGLRAGDGGAHLITFHPRGPGQSSRVLHSAAWLDFNMIQSSHGARDHDNGLFVEHDLALTPPKPTLDGEPRYEAIPVGFYNSDVRQSVRCDDYDVRQAAYWAVLAGACGHTYGNNNIWQMWSPGHKPVINACTPWYEALDHPGAFQMGILRRLFESRPWQTLVPDGTFIVDGPASGGAKIRAARAEDHSFAFVYSPRGAPFTVRQNVVQAQTPPTRVAATWFDPRYGIATPLHTSDDSGFQTFVPPTSGRGQDWILVLDDAARGYPPPGTSATPSYPADRRLGHLAPNA
ncbi:MAG: glycoside hydrolase family 140 protein [Anaerolineae bacterium]|nr:glycoside hydrolase family 140 protein [Anaerolineae bacterium]